MRPVRFLPLLLLLLAVILGPARRAAADGMVFRRPPVVEDPWIPDQRALLHWAHGEETLVIETSVNGGGEDLAWVVPLPSPPEVEEAPAGLFPALSEAFGPKVEVEAPWWIPFLVLPFLRWWFGRTAASVGFRLAVMGLIWAAAPALIFGKPPGETGPGSLALLVVILAAAPAACRIQGNEWPAVTWFVILFGAVLILVMAGFVGYGKIMAAGGGGGGVRVLGVTQAGRFDVTTLQAGDSGALAAWMREHDFHLPPETRPAVEAYVREGWVFAAMKARRGGARGSGPLHPVTFRFPSERPVYPMRLTASATGGRALGLDLFILGPSTAFVPGMVLKRSSLTYGEGGAAGPVRGSGRTLAGASPEIRRWFGDARVGTWLRGSLPVEQLSRDVMPVWTETVLHEPTATTVIGAIHASLNRAVLVIPVFGALIIRERAWRKGGNDRICEVPGCRDAHPLLLSLAMTGVVWSLAYGVVLNTVSIRRSGGSAGTSPYDKAYLKSAWFDGAAFTHQLQEHEPGSGRNPGSMAERIREEWSDGVLINADGPPGEPSLICREDEKGTTVWFQGHGGDRVHLVTWRPDGVLDARPGRIPVWELPPGTSGHFKWR